MPASHKLVRFSYPHSSNIVNDSTLSPTHQQPSTPEPATISLPTTLIPTRPSYLDAVRPSFIKTKTEKHFIPDWQKTYSNHLHVPTLSTFLIHCFYFNPDHAQQLVNYFNISARVQPPLTLTRPIVRHRRKHISHFEPQRSDPYCTCSCCHYSCPTHSL